MSRLYHVGIPEEHVPTAALLVSPDVALKSVMRACGAVRPVGANREYRSFMAGDHARPLLVTTVGHGGPPLAIAVEELARAGGEVFVLIDAPAALHDHSASVLAVQAAVRREGTSRHYAPASFPAVPDPELFAALSNALPPPASAGIVCSS